MKRFYVILAVLALVAFMPAGPAAADNDNGLRAVPFEFVGTAAQCGDPAGSRIVTAAWLNGMGLPDNLGLNNNNTTAAARADQRSGLLLSKNGLTSDCSSSGAEIKGVKGMTTTATSALGFDYRNGGHCGAGAPRFNVVVRNGSTETSHFVGGCANDNEAAQAPQDPLQWTRVRFELSDAGEAFPVVPIGSKIVSIDILYDEGTDTPSLQDAQGVGLAVLDNIFIDGKVITSGDNNQKDKKDNNDDHDEGDD
jgi:hypothetical protein